VPIPASSSDADDALDDAQPAGPFGARRATGTIFRAGCLLLVALGVIQIVMIGFPYMFSSDSVRCTGARNTIEAANDDDDDFNDVSLPEGVDEVDDIPCDEAVELAANIPEEEDEEPSGEFISAGAIRNQGIAFTAVSLAMVATGIILLRTRDRRARIAALVLCALGILVPLLQLISLVGFAFVVFALAFSSDAKAIFGQGFGFFRPRPPRPAAEG
jgi:hypothetical protein